jgi:hypothetical protein
MLESHRAEQPGLWDAVDRLRAALNTEAGNEVSTGAATRSGNVVSL